MGGLGEGRALLVALGGGALVPGLVGSFEPFVMLLSISPDILLCYLLLDYVPSQLRRGASMTLPRVGLRPAWVARRCGALLAVVVCYEVVSTVLACAAGVATGMAPRTLADCAPALVLSVFLSSVFLAALVLWENVVALLRDAVVGLVAVVGVHVGALLMLAYAPSSVARPVAPWLVFSRGVPAWHDALSAPFGAQAGMGAQMSPLVSLAIGAALALLAFCALQKTVRDVDIF